MKLKFHPGDLVQNLGFEFIPIFSTRSNGSGAPYQAYGEALERHGIAMVIKQHQAKRGTDNETEIFTATGLRGYVLTRYLEQGR